MPRSPYPKDLIGLDRIGPTSRLDQSLWPESDRTPRGLVGRRTDENRTERCRGFERLYERDRWTNDRLGDLHLLGDRAADDVPCGHADPTRQLDSMASLK